MKELYISRLLAENLLQLADSMSLNEDADFGRGLKHHLADQAETMVPFSLYAQFYEYCIASSGNELFGLYQGEKYNLAALGVVGQIIQVSSTLQEGVEKSCENFNLISNVLQLDFELSEGFFDLEFKIHPLAEERYPIACQHLVLSSMVFVRNELDYLTLNKVEPLQVSFAIEHDNSKPFERVFRAPIHLSASTNYMRFSLKDVQQKIVFADYELLQTLEAVACARLKEQMQLQTSYSDTIRGLIYNLVNPAFPSFETVAAHLNMSTRSLQRKLKLEDTSYSEIVHQVKKELVLDYLNRDLSIKEVAYLMGYAESSSFVNAFKKWFGHTPAKFRQLKE